MAMRLIAVPPVEPVSLADMKLHLNIDHALEDLTLTTLIVVARAMVESLSQRLLIAQDWLLTLDRVPAGGLVHLPLSPVIAVTSVTVLDEAGGAAVWPATSMIADLVGDAPRLLFTGAPPVPGRPIGGIEIRLTAGYGPTAAAVPPALVQAVKLLTAHWYESRGNVASATIPDDVRALVDGFRPRRLAA